MALLVQKYGGSSVGTLERINHVASRIIEAKNQGHDLVVVVSAMQGDTDRLIQLAEALTPSPDAREYDVLVSTGEHISMSLLAIALQARNCPARSFSGYQIGILTDDTHTKARILEVKTTLIQDTLKKGYVVIVAGFQGINAAGDITTLGRGGSDTTAVALASALNAAECQIYTDVEGVFTTDPHVVPEATLLEYISFEEMREMANLGAKVLQMRSVELACQHNMPIRVLSTFTKAPGTLVTFDKKISKINSARRVSGIAFSRKEALIFLKAPKDHTHLTAQLLERVKTANIEIDMASPLTFTLPRSDYDKLRQLIEEVDQLGIISVKSHQNVAKLSLVGSDIHRQETVALKVQEVLAQLDIPIQVIINSAIKISVVIDELNLERGVQAIHHAFDLHNLSTV